LRDVAGKPGSSVRFGAFAGYKQNVGDQPTVPFCERVEGINNVVVALPSVLANAWRNAHAVLGLLDGDVAPGGPPDLIPYGGEGARVGAVNELTDEVMWQGLAEFEASLING